jgi:hypothetical protein
MATSDLSFTSRSHIRSHRQLNHHHSPFTHPPKKSLPHPSPCRHNHSNKLTRPTLLKLFRNSLQIKNEAVLNSGDECLPLLPSVNLASVGIQHHI